MTTEVTGQECGICGLDPLTHAQRESERVINHVWNVNGDLVPLKAAEKPTPKPVILIVDADLREVLLRKGVITVEDFTALRDSRSGATGNREAGETEGTG